MFQVPAATSQAPFLFGPEETQEVMNVAAEKPSDKKVVQTASSSEETNKSKKPAGAVSLFGGINVLEHEAKSTTVRIKTMLLKYLIDAKSCEQTKVILCLCAIEAEQKCTGGL